MKELWYWSDKKNGIALAKKRGVYKGRKKIEVPLNYEEVMQKWAKRELSSKRAMELLGLKSTKFYEFLKDYKEARA